MKETRQPKRDTRLRTVRTTPTPKASEVLYRCENCGYIKRDASACETLHNASPVMSKPDAIISVAVATKRALDGGLTLERVLIEVFQAWRSVP